MGTVCEQLAGLWRCTYAYTELSGDGDVQLYRCVRSIQSNHTYYRLDILGVAIYFLSPRWPYAVTTAVSLDSGPSFLIDLVDHSRPNAGEGPETVQSQVVWNATGLSNTQHTLVISVGQGQSYGIVDGLMSVFLRQYFLLSSN